MTHSNQFNWASFHHSPLIGILRGKTKHTIMHIVECMMHAELYTVEVTMNTDGASDILSNLVQEFPMMNIGAGTVCSLDDYNKAASCGVKYIVTPIINEAVIEKVSQTELPYFIGAFSPTEIYKAWQLGATAVKVFPNSLHGIQYIKTLLAPLDSIKLIPTGGIKADEMKSYFDIGVFGLGIGGALFKAELIKEKKWSELTQHFHAIKSSLK